MRGIRRDSTRTYRVLLVLHRVRIRRIDRTDCERSRDRISESKGTVIRVVLPVIKVVARLILRRGRRSQHRAVRHLCTAVIEDNLVRVRRIRRCGIQHLDRVGIDFPDSGQREIRSDRASDKLELRAIRCFPVLKVIAVALSRRGGRNACRIVLNRRLRHAVAVAMRLGRRRKAALIRIEGNRVARQGIGILKTCLCIGHRCAARRIDVRNRSNRAQCIAETAATLRHHIGNRVDAGIVTVVLCAAAVLFQRIDIGTGHRKVEGSAREGSTRRRILSQDRGTRCNQREVIGGKRIVHNRVLPRRLIAGALFRRTGRHRLCRHMRRRKGGAGQREAEVLCGERGALSVRQEAVVPL